MYYEGGEEDGKDGRGSVGDIENGTGGRARYARLSSQVYLNSLPHPTSLPLCHCKRSVWSGVSVKAKSSFPYDFSLSGDMIGKKFRRDNAVLQ